MRTVVLAALSLHLAACTAAFVEHEAIASNDAVEAGTNSVLVTNILRARDGAPTFYSDISHLRGALQGQAGLTSPLAVGPYDVSHWTGRSLITPSLSMQTSPSFDVAPLNTESFTRGINEPIDVRVFQYYLDRAIPADLLLQLFVDKIEDVRYEAGRAAITPTYNVACGAAEGGCGPGTGERAFDARIRGWTQPYLFLHPYKLLMPHGPVMASEESGARAPTFKDLAGTASQTLVLRPAQDDAGRPGYRYYTVSNNIAFCVPAAGRQRSIPITVRRDSGEAASTQVYQIVRVARNTVSGSAATISESVDPSACVRTEVFGRYRAETNATESYTALHFRSVDGMIEFLGRMLRVPPEQRPLSFDISQDSPETARFSVGYRGTTYHVHDRHHVLENRTACAGPPCPDRTLEILTLVNQLLNLHKNRSDLPATGAVQVVN